MRAAVWAYGERATASGLAAAWWHGLTRFAPRSSRSQCQARQPPCQRPGVRDATTRSGAKADAVERQGLRVTALALTVVEAAVRRGGGRRHGLGIATPSRTARAMAGTPAQQGATRLARRAAPAAGRVRRRTLGSRTAAVKLLLRRPASPAGGRTIRWADTRSTWRFRRGQGGPSRPTAGRSTATRKTSRTIEIGRTTSPCSVGKCCASPGYLTEYPQRVIAEYRPAQRCQQVRNGSQRVPRARSRHHVVEGRVNGARDRGERPIPRHHQKPRRNAIQKNTSDTVRSAGRARPLHRLDDPHRLKPAEQFLDQHPRPSAPSGQVDRRNEATPSTTARQQYHSMADHALSSTTRCRSGVRLLAMSNRLDHPHLSTGDLEYRSGVAVGRALPDQHLLTPDRRTLPADLAARRGGGASTATATSTAPSPRSPSAAPGQTQPAAELVGMLGQREQPAGDRVAGGLGARAEQQGEEQIQLGVGERPGSGSSSVACATIDSMSSAGSARLDAMSSWP